jgi:hypothetical protein
VPRKTPIENRKKLRHLVMLHIDVGLSFWLREKFLKIFKDKGTSKWNVYWNAVFHYIRQINHQICSFLYPPLYPNLRVLLKFLICHSFVSYTTLPVQVNQLVFFDFHWIPNKKHNVSSRRGLNIVQAVLKLPAFKIP